MPAYLWKFLNTDIQEFFSTKAATTGAESAKAVLELGKALKEQGSKDINLAPFVQQISSLLDILNSPMAQVVGSTLPFINIATSLLQLYAGLTKRDPTLEQSVALVSQAAYLESFQVIMGLSKNHKLLQNIGNAPASKEVEQRIHQLAELELDASEAKRTVTCFHTSKLAQAFNNVLTMRLHQAGLSEVEAQRLSDRIAWNTHRYINQALVDVGERVKPLAELYRNGGCEVLEKYQSIDTYQEEYIKPKPLETVFAETFTFRDIYVPSKAQLIGKDGSRDENQLPVNLEQWAKDLLNDNNYKDRVIFVQGGPGRGKSVFCRMFADWVRQQEYPRWIPILIRLREIRLLDKDFEETLRKAVDRDFSKNDQGWLTDRNIRFLFLLDGFDELLMEGRTSGGLEEFLRQVGKFQESCASNSEKGHRVLLTGRTLSLQSVERLMPPNLERIEILPMDDALQNWWLALWGRLVGTEKTFEFQQFLQDDRCPERVRELAREPLLLYLLAAMHRDRELNLEMFKGADSAKAKVLIYKRTLDWVLTQQRPAWLNRDLTELETDSLSRILAEAGLCVVQSEGECASIKLIEERLNRDYGVQSLIETARKRLKENPLKNALAAFYLQPANNKEVGGSVEFAHKSFSEFLYAKRLAESLEEWSLPGIRRQEFYIPTEQMNWEIYDLLGYGSLTPEIVEYLMVLITTNSSIRTVKLFNRLEEFYLRWCAGDFIDSPSENPPQKKMRMMKEVLIDKDRELGQRQVDIYAGLNVLILLLELHRYAQSEEELKQYIFFYPCGAKERHSFDALRLLKIIGYSHCVSGGAFRRIVGRFLNKICLDNTILAGAYLWATNFEGTSFRNANLQGTTFNGLYRWNSSSAELESSWHKEIGSVFLSQYTNLKNVDFSGTNLKCCNLRGADLSNSCFNDANLEGIIWDKHTKWEGVQNLEMAVNVPQELQKQLGD